jgi:hypothetical protein
MVTEVSQPLAVARQILLAACTSRAEKRASGCRLRSRDPAIQRRCGGLLVFNCNCARRTQSG